MAEIQRYWQDGMLHADSKGDLVFRSESEAWHLADKTAALAAQAEEHRTKLAELNKLYEEELISLQSQHAKELAEAETKLALVTRLHGEEIEFLEAQRGEGESALIAKLYRKKPIEVEAIQYDGDNGSLISRWSEQAILCVRVLKSTDGSPQASYLQIETLEGRMTAIVGDWIIKGAVGEFYPCKPKAFEATFEMEDNNA